MWAVYLQDTNGSLRLVSRDFNSDESANQFITSLEGSHSKKHKVDYFIIEYTKETMQQIFENLGIRY